MKDAKINVKKKKLLIRVLLNFATVREKIWPTTRNILAQYAAYCVEITED